TQGDLSNPLKPNIHLEITSGEGIAGVTSPSSLSTQQIQALYDTIVKTIRIRPIGGHDKTSDATPAAPKAPDRLPLGSKVASGRPCPESGLWQCTHPQATPRQQSFTIGQTLPSVLVPNQRSLWQKLKGAPEELAIDSEWELVQLG
ncbi:T6SS immunity protein Tli4 family protein, partial [Paludibacterium purpuratum]